MPPNLLGDRDKAGRPEEINGWLVENGGKNKVAVISSNDLWKFSSFKTPYTKIYC